MNGRLSVALLALCGLLLLCLLSRMCEGLTRLGKQGTTTVKRAVSQLIKDVMVLQVMSQQDELPILSLLHNAEALATVRVALALTQEHGINSNEELLDLHSQLKEEQETLLEALHEEDVRDQRFKPE